MFDGSESYDLADITCREKGLSGCQCATMVRFFLNEDVHPKTDLSVYIFPSTTH